MKRSAIRDIGSNMWILKFHLWHRYCKDITLQSATNEIVTKDRKTILQHKEKTDKSRDPLVNKKKWLTFPRIYKWLPFNAQGTKRIWLWEQDKTTRCQMVVSKLVQSTDAFCASSALKQTVLMSLITGHTFKELGNTSCRTENCTYLISCKVCFQQYIVEILVGDLCISIINHCSTI